MTTTELTESTTPPAYTPTRELTLDVLLREILVELNDEKYSGRTHGRPATYSRGCRGHLCKYSHRTRQRLMRSEATRASLPEGVLPETRPRSEQTWDEVITKLLSQLHEGPLEMEAEQLAASLRVPS